LNKVVVLECFDRERYKCHEEVAILSLKLHVEKNKFMHIPSDEACQVIKQEEINILLHEPSN